MSSTVFTVGVMPMKVQALTSGVMMRKQLWMWH